MGEGALFFFLALRTRSHELADVFKKNEKKNQTLSVYRLEIMEPLWYAPCHLFCRSKQYSVFIPFPNPPSKPEQ